ncbi:hypothetical protein F4859DRAFT_521264 [Xylaria cf. heliscus]|nr:hypothetical protein F4859DRAFT_521264 [Xylaria cf. heliscus]
MATPESISDELASTCLSDGVVSVSTSDSMSSTPADDSTYLVESLVFSELEDDDKPNSEYVGVCMTDWDPPNPPQDDNDDDADYDGMTPLEEVQERMRAKWGSRREVSRYTQVIVLLISWEKHDLGAGLQDAITKYQTMFEELYNYEVWSFRIPSKKPHLALTRQLVQLAQRDCPDTLFIIWYDGHGLEHADRRGAPRWCSHHDPEKSRSVDSGIVPATLNDCEADILLVNNSCESLTCDRFNSKGIVESISASAFNTTTYGSIQPDDLSPSMTWAAYRILRDRQCVEDGITVTELHRRICLSVQFGFDQRSNFNDSDVLTWDTSSIRTQPVYTRLSADAPGPGGRTRGIVLGKLRERYEQYDSNEASADMRVRLQVMHPDQIRPKEWIDWLLSAPSCVDKAFLEVRPDDAGPVW